MRKRLKVACVPACFDKVLLAISAVVEFHKTIEESLFLKQPLISLSCLVKLATTCHIASNNISNVTLRAILYNCRRLILKLLHSSFTYWTQLSWDVQDIYVTACASKKQVGGAFVFIEADGFSSSERRV